MTPLFQDAPTRADLLALPLPENLRHITIAVHRNHAFELAASALNPFLALSGLQADFWYSDYDDSLSFAHMPPKADIHIIWVDAAKYRMENFAAWLSGRAQALREAGVAELEAGADKSGIYTDNANIAEGIFKVEAGNAYIGPDQSKSVALNPANGLNRPKTGANRIIVACTGTSGLTPELPATSAITLKLPDQTLFLDVDAATAHLGGQAFSERLQALAGTRLSNSALLLAARELGCRYIPALLLTPLKALVLDLDNTLYDGVLGEDGIQGVTPRQAVQKRLKELAGQGFMLALASKNEEDDVKRLFAERADFALRWEDFSAARINWRPKPENIAEIARDLNIGLDAMLFVDDNPGEALRAAVELPELHVAEAPSAEVALNILRFYPGLMKTSFTAEDALRGADARANAARRELGAGLSAEEYVAALQIEMDFAVNKLEQLPRVTELLNKTNQFILSFKRPDPAEAAKYMAEPNRCVVTAAMRDKLSDSGIIAVLLARQNGDMYVDELAVSCRALGRGVENGMLAQMLRLAAEHLGNKGKIFVCHKTGPRNKPALDWLASCVAVPQKDNLALLPALPAAELAGVKTRLLG